MCTNNEKCNCIHKEKCSCLECSSVKSSPKAACCGSESNKHTHEKGKEGIRQDGNEQSKYHHICNDIGCKKNY